jgi:hypothetical protein
MLDLQAAIIPSTDSHYSFVTVSNWSRISISIFIQPFNLLAYLLLVHIKQTLTINHINLVQKPQLFGSCSCMQTLR